MRSIESLCTRITSGGTPLRSNRRFYDGGTIPWVKTGELKDWYIEDTDEKITEEAIAQSSAKVFPRQTVLMAMYGDGRTITSLGILRTEAASNQACCAMMPDPSHCHPLFLFYSLKAHRDALLKLAYGGAQRNLNAKTIKQFEIPVPPLSVQGRVVKLLSAYDDLIENNTRRIKILEEMAQMLYRDWFVHFRFPGHEKVQMVESQLGPIPKGWLAKCVTDSVVVNPSTTVSKEGTKPFVPMGSLSETSMLIMNTDEREGNSGSKFKNGDTLFARITPCLENGKTGFVQFLPSDDAVAFGSTEFIVLRSKTVCPEYVYLMARSNEFRDNAIKSMSGATGRQRVQEACFSRFFIAQPDPARLARFQDVVTPMFRLVHALASKNANLRTTRDLLLPKLISGEIPVEAADETAAELMEATA
ncbi:MAG TPA: restriction endonuclease subunit S [Bryobacteraceae bacterium]|nr:restriction endonuclease subunit S [Bryobacteraceae bacterium]